jgi:outer membrane protein TolC
MNAVTVVVLALSLTQAPGGQEAAAPRAEPAAPAMAKLTLEQALEIAEKKNFDLKIAAAQLRQADEISAKAWSYYLPQVKATGTWLRNERELTIDLDGTPAAGDPPNAPPITLIAKDQVTGQLDASQVLLSPSLIFSIQGAHRTEDALRNSVEGGRSALRFGVAQAFYTVSALAKTVSVAERLLEVAQRQERDAHVRYKAGTIARVGALRAEIDRAGAERDLARARNGYESARLALATLLDRPADFEVVEPPEPAQPGDAAALEKRALAERNDVLAARATAAAARSERNAAIGRYLPDVAAYGRYSRTNAAGFTGDAETIGYGLVLSWNILDGGLRESDVRTGNAKIDEADARLQRAEATALEDVRMALLDLDSARANAEKAKEQRDLAAENQRLLDVSYKAGAATAVEQADATAALRSAELAVQVEQLNAQRAALRVMQAVGATTPLPK